LSSLNKNLSSIRFFDRGAILDKRPETLEACKDQCCDFVHIFAEKIVKKLATNEKGIIKLAWATFWDILESI
jgi:hypothetical protein